MEVPVKVDVWSDVVCPWCYIGKRRLESAVAAFGEPVEIVFHAFELDPNAPKGGGAPVEEMLARKYGMGPQRVAEVQAHVTATAAKDGIRFDLARTRVENTFDAHRLVALARTLGRQAEVKEAFVRGYFSEGRRVGEAATLRELAVGAGLPAAEVDRVLADPTAFAADVRGDEAQARQLGIRGVPFFVIDGKYGVSGAQPVEVLRGALERARLERAPVAPAGPGCDGDACEVPDR